MVNSVLEPEPMHYQYPDPHDDITRAAVARNNQQATWLSNEARLHGCIRSLLWRRFGRPLRILDVGTGPGRLVPEYIGLSRFYAAVDRDPARIGRDFIEAAARAAGTRVDIRASQGCSLAELYGAPFDFIIVSHVLQHVAPEAADELLEQCLVKLAAGGWLYVALPVTHCEDDEHVILWTEAGLPCWRRVGEAELADACERPDAGRLPGKVFSLAAIQGLCRRHRLAIRRMIAYHYTWEYQGDPACLLPLSGNIPPGICDLALLLERGSA